MNLQSSVEKDRSSYVEFLLLCFYALLGSLIFSVLSFGIIYLLYGEEVLNQIFKNEILDSNINAFKLFQAFGTSLGLMFMPALLIAYTSRVSVKHYFDFNNPKINLIGLTILIMAAANPLLEASALFNQLLVLPKFLEPLEIWMAEKEEALAIVTLKMLEMPSFKDFLINIVVIALLPSIAEEFMFRGVITKIFNKSFGNIHVAIWMSAIIFSAIHMQFYGFLPRLLLGAGFGYLYYFGGSIWYPIIGHFINNGTIVLVTYIMQLKKLPLEQTNDAVGYTWYFYFFSAFLTLVLFFTFKKKSTING